MIDPDDPDSVSAGSFFTNPILDPAHFETLEERVAADLGPDARLPSFPEPDGQVKTSAAWLVERAGFGRGYGAPGPIMVSTKHSLALTNRGGGTTARAGRARARDPGRRAQAVRRRAHARARPRRGRLDDGKRVRDLKGAAAVPRRARAGPRPRRARPSPAATTPRNAKSESVVPAVSKSTVPTWRIRSSTPCSVFTFCTRSSLRLLRLAGDDPALDVKAVVRDRVRRPDPDHEPGDQDDSEDEDACADARARVCRSAWRSHRRRPRPGAPSGTKPGAARNEGWPEKSTCSPGPVSMAATLTQLEAVRDYASRAVIELGHDGQDGRRREP